MSLIESVMVDLLTIEISFDDAFKYHYRKLLNNGTYEKRQGHLYLTIMFNLSDMVIFNDAYKMLL